VDSLIGAWRLVDHFDVTEDGEPKPGISNMAPGTVAYLIYAADGHMAYQHMREVRPAFAGGSLRGGTPEERLAAVDNMNCYCGTYDVRDDTIIHHVEAALFPNWVGTDLVRTFTLGGDELRVTTSASTAGHVGKPGQRVTLVFQRT
jgi:hypothetical protein